MNETYKALAHAASAQCELLGSNNAWLWERQTNYRKYSRAEGT